MSLISNRLPHTASSSIRILGSPLIFLVFLLFTRSGFTQGREPSSPTELTPPGLPPHSRFSFYLDNDGTFLRLRNKTDRYYTSGIGLSFTQQGPLAATWTDWLPLSRDYPRSRRAWGLTLGQLMFTPTDLWKLPPDPRDHPYAGYLYAGLFLQRSNQSSSEHFQLDLGMVGSSSLAASTQRLIHQWTQTVVPAGWNAQLHNEPIVQLHGRKSWSPDAFRWTPLGRSQLTIWIVPDAVLALGNLWRHAELGTTLRFGWPQALPSGPDRLTRIGELSSPPPLGWSLEAYLRPSLRVSEHNLFLAGNTWRSSPRVEAIPWLWSFEWGAGVAYSTPPATLSLNYGQTRRSPEFVRQEGPHLFASLTCSLLVNF